MKEYFVSNLNELHDRLVEEGVVSFDDACFIKGDDNGYCVIVNDASYLDYSLPMCLADTEYRIERSYQ